MFCFVSDGLDDEGRRGSACKSRIANAGPSNKVTLAAQVFEESLLFLEAENTDCSQIMNQNLFAQRCHLPLQSEARVPLRFQILTHWRNHTHSCNFQKKNGKLAHRQCAFSIRLWPPTHQKQLSPTCTTFRQKEPRGTQPRSFCPVPRLGSLCQREPVLDILFLCPTTGLQLLVGGCGFR